MSRPSSSAARISAGRQRSHLGEQQAFELLVIPLTGGRAFGIEISTLQVYGRLQRCQLLPYPFDLRITPRHPLVVGGNQQNPRAFSMERRRPGASAQAPITSTTRQLPRMPGKSAWAKWPCSCRRVTFLRFGAARLIRFQRGTVGACTGPGLVDTIRGDAGRLAVEQGPLGNSGQGQTAQVSVLYCHPERRTMWWAVIWLGWCTPTACTMLEQRKQGLSGGSCRPASALSATAQ